MHFKLFRETFISIICVYCIVDTEVYGEGYKITSYFKSCLEKYLKITRLEDELCLENTGSMLGLKIKHYLISPSALKWPPNQVQAQDQSAEVLAGRKMSPLTAWVVLAESSARDQEYRVLEGKVKQGPTSRD